MVISSFEFDFRRCGFFLNDSNRWCVQKWITCNETVHVPVLWPVCAPQIHFECCGVRDDSWYHIYIQEMQQKTWNHCGKSKASSNRRSWKVSDVQIVRYTWVLSPFFVSLCLCVCVCLCVLCVVCCVLCVVCCVLLLLLNGYIILKE